MTTGPPAPSDESFKKRGRVLIGLTLLLIVGLAGLTFRFPTQPEPVRIEASSLPGRELRVYVSGQVRQPGVYSFRPGDRIEDALRLAGGTTPEADVGQLNLAARLRDEGRVHVPGRVRSDGGPLAGNDSSPSATKRINVNAATARDLDTLPGIGAVIAQRIIESREREGPFASIDELRSRRLVPPSTLDRIRDRIVAE